MSYFPVIVSLWDKSDVQQWLLSIGSKRHINRFLDADLEVLL